MKWEKKEGQGRKEQVFITGRTGTLHHSLQSKGGKQEAA
jgi:hypothetical protein